MSVVLVSCSYHARVMSVVLVSCSWHARIMSVMLVPCAYHACVRDCVRASGHGCFAGVALQSPVATGVYSDWMRALPAARVDKELWPL